jgi:putative inorganic carbon (hco3(-)) transporter
MDTLFFLLFCLAVGYVCLWVIVNENNGSANGDWGFIAMRTADEEPKEEVEPARNPGLVAVGGHSGRLVAKPRLTRDVSSHAGLLFVLIFVSYLGTVFVTPFCGVLLWIWISLMAPHNLTYGLLPFSYALVIAVVTIIAFVFSRERSFPPNTAVTWALIGMVVFCTAALLNAYDFARAYSRWDTIWKGIFVSLLSLPLLHSRLRIHAYVWVFVLSVGYFGVKGGLFTFMTGGSMARFRAGRQYARRQQSLGDRPGDDDSADRVFGVHSRMAAMRMACWGFAFMTFVGSVFTYSRGGILAMIGALAVLWYRSSFKLARRWRAFGAIVVVLFAPETLWARFGSIDDFRQDGRRWGVWRSGAFASACASNPLFGIGFHGTTLPSLVASVDGNGRPRAVHNSYIEVLVEAGIFAFLCHMTSFSRDLLLPPARAPLVAWPAGLEMGLRSRQHAAGLGGRLCRGQLLPFAGVLRRMVVHRHPGDGAAPARARRTGRAGRAAGAAADGVRPPQAGRCSRVALTRRRQSSSPAVLSGISAAPRPPFPHFPVIRRTRRK